MAAHIFGVDIHADKVRLEASSVDDGEPRVDIYIQGDGSDRFTVYGDEQLADVTDAIDTYRAVRALERSTA